MRSGVSITQHKLTVDEPQSLGTADGGPNAVELTFGAPGSCQEITNRACALALGIPLESVSVTVEGEIDLRGLFTVDDSVRAAIKRSAAWRIWYQVPARSRLNYRVARSMTIARYWKFSPSRVR